MSRCLGILLLLPLASSAGEKTIGERKPIIVVEGGGKEIALKDWSFVSGTKHLSWLAPKGAKAKKGEPVGPECLEFRESKLEMYQEDVTTFIPLTALKQLEYDHKAKEVAVTFLDPAGKDVTLRGPTRFKGINQFMIDGVADSATIDIGGPVRILEGSLRAGFKALRFPDPHPTPEVAGAPAAVSVRGKEKTVHQTADLMPLYRVAGAYRRSPTLVFQKGVQMEVGDIARLKHAPATRKGGTLDFEVEKRDGMKQGFTLLEKLEFGEKESGTLLGFVGRVPAGWRLFPATIVAELSWSAADKE